MRGLTCAILMGILAGAPLAGGEDFDLSVMAFNIRYGTADDGPNSWHYREAMVADMLRQYDADIIGAQETLDFQADYLVDVLPEYRWFGVGRDGDGFGEHCAILYKKDVVRPVKIGNFWLSETPEIPGSVSWDSALTRMVTWARFQHLETGRFFVVYNTHFDHRGAEARTESARLIRAHIAEQPEDLPVIVLGDFNAAAEDSEPWDVLVDETHLEDAWLTATETAGPPMTWSAFGPPPEEGHRRIDWILTDGYSDVHLCETVLYNQQGRYPSDHYPVYAEITVGTEDQAG